MTFIATLLLLSLAKKTILWNDQVCVLYISCSHPAPTSHLLFFPSFIPFLLPFSCFQSSFFFSSQPAPWKRGGMCCHSNKLTHWQDCTIIGWATGGQQQIQAVVAAGGVGRHPCLGALFPASRSDRWVKGESVGGGGWGFLPLCVRWILPVLLVFTD